MTSQARIRVKKGPGKLDLMLSLFDCLSKKQYSELETDLIIRRVDFTVCQYPDKFFWLPNEIPIEVKEVKIIDRANGVYAVKGINIFKGFYDLYLNLYEYHTQSKRYGHGDVVIRFPHYEDFPKKNGSYDLEEVREEIQSIAFNGIDPKKVLPLTVLIIDALSKGTGKIDGDGIKKLILLKKEIIDLVHVASCLGDHTAKILLTNLLSKSQPLQ